MLTWVGLLEVERGSKLQRARKNFIWKRWNLDSSLFLRLFAQLVSPVIKAIPQKTYGSGSSNRDCSRIEDPTPLQRFLYIQTRIYSHTTASKTSFFSSTAQLFVFKSSACPLAVKNCLSRLHRPQMAGKIQLPHHLDEWKKLRNNFVRLRAREGDPQHE